jgi:hypothetical protein
LIKVIADRDPFRKILANLPVTPTKGQHRTLTSSQ